MDLGELQSVNDPTERVLAAHRQLQQLHAEIARVKDVRDLALNELRHTSHLSLRAIADALSAGGWKLSKTQVSNITG